ncbi:MAG TPA: hypothetical protein VN578_20590 [Candidatus Binatia bacterium]|jgi:hypothetical protein|nr:hypothetical protein [Candidatus Binatia bacterium]
MIKSTLKIVVPGLLMLGMAVLPGQLLAQNTNKAGAEKKAVTETKEPSKAEKKSSAGTTEGSEKKRTGGGVHGKLAAVEMTAKTITLGKHTYQVTSETKIFKGGKPATLEDGVVGEPVSLGYKTGKDGQLVATKVTFGDTKMPERKGATEKK